MSALRHFRVASVLVLLLGVASVARAQQDSPYSPFYGAENDLQWFDQVDFDLNGELEEPSGFWYGYERTYWAATGHRNQLGDPDATSQSYIPWAALGLQGDGVFTPFSNSTLPPPYQAVAPIIYGNSVLNNSPRASYALGHRHEIGYNYDGRGWLIGFIDYGKHSHRTQLGLEGGMQSHPVQPDDDDDDDDDDDEDADPDFFASPFGDVFVNFAAPVGYNLGFVDIVTEDIAPGGRILPDDPSGDFILEGDGIADDLDGDGIFGPDGPLGAPNPLVPPDYDDLVVLPYTFSRLSAFNNTETRAIELMRRLQLKNSHFMKKRQHNVFELYYGVRFMEVDDRFLVVGTGGTMGDSEWDTRIQNQIIGPQMAYKWNHRRGRWLLNSQGRAMLGYNIQDWTQEGFVHEDQIPGAVNHFLQAVPVSFNHGRSNDDFSPVGELRFEAAYLVTSNVQVKLSYTGTYIGGIARAADSVRYELPTMGFVEGDADSTFINGVGIGIEINQ